MIRGTWVALVLSLSLGFIPAADAVDIVIIEDSGFFNTPGVTLGTLGMLSSEDPSSVTILGTAGDGLNYGGIDFRADYLDDFHGFENTTNSLRKLVLMGGSSLVESVGYLDTGVAGLTFSNDGAIAYAAGTVSAWGRIVEADAQTGAVIDVHNFVGIVFSALATVPEGTDLPYPPGEIWAVENTGVGARLRRVDLTNDTTTSVGLITGVGFEQEFEVGLDWAPDGTLYAVIQGYRFIGGGDIEEVSSHLFVIDPATAQATDLGVIQGDQTWDVSSLAVMPEACSETYAATDLPLFVDCLDGPSAGPTTALCRCSDADGDHDVDLADFAVFQSAFMTR